MIAPFLKNDPLQSHNYSSKNLTSRLPSGRDVRLARLVIAISSGVIAQSSTTTQWKKSATINIIIHKPSTHTKLLSPTRRSGVGLTTPPPPLGYFMYIQGNYVLYIHKEIF